MSVVVAGVGWCTSVCVWLWPGSAGVQVCVCGCGRGWLVYKCVCGCGQGRLVYKSLAADVNSMLVVIDTDSLQPVDHVALAHGERNLDVAVVNHGTE